MDWWILELITIGVLVVIVAVLGPLIKRFGKAYAADVFRANPRTGKSYLVLMDFAYYMIFGAYILFVIQWEPQPGWGETVDAEQIQNSVVRIGGMILLMGLLHGLNVLTLPIIGRIFTLNRRLDDDLESADEAAASAAARMRTDPGPARDRYDNNDRTVDRPSTVERPVAHSTDVPLSDLPPSAWAQRPAPSPGGA